MTTKICNECKITKNHSNFVKNKSSKDGLNRICKLCFKKYNILKRYNITYEAYIDLLTSQNYKCSICLKSLVINGPTSNRPNIDHCHKSKIIRGILCEKCNQGLGLLKDSIDIIDKSIDYLTEFNSVV